MSFGLLGLAPILDVGAHALGSAGPVVIEVEFATYLNGLNLGQAWSGEIPQSAKLPAIVVNVISENFNGRMAGLAGLVATTFQLDCYATTRKVAATNLEVVAGRLADFSGPMGRARVQTIVRQEGMTTSDPFDNGTGSVTQRKMGQFCVYWSR